MYLELQENLRAKAISAKTKGRGFTHDPISKLTTKLLVTTTHKTMWHWHKNRQIYQWVRLSQEICQYIYSHLIFNKTISREKNSLFNTWFGDNWTSHAKE